ncbi:hypothetical protein TRVA0_029S01310 [Trichomonascus vanleenenianus]|uniref:uncharacterized protein n=1 Tax=Trichomonascus vanleenenianus TaxID=2268995 RepID=UPI003ECB4697
MPFSSDTNVSDFLETDIANLDFTFVNTNARFSRKTGLKKKFRVKRVTEVNPSYFTDIGSKIAAPYSRKKIDDIPFPARYHIRGEASLRSTLFSKVIDPLQLIMEEVIRPSKCLLECSQDVALEKHNRYRPDLFTTYRMEEMGERRSYSIGEYKTPGSLALDAESLIPMGNNEFRIRRNIFVRVNQVERYVRKARVPHAFVSDGSTSILIDFNPFLNEDKNPAVAFITKDNCDNCARGKTFKLGYLGIQGLGLQHCGLLGEDFKVVERHDFKSDREIQSSSSSSDDSGHRHTNIESDDDESSDYEESSDDDGEDLNDRSSDVDYVDFLEESSDEDGEAQW